MKIGRGPDPYLDLMIGCSYGMLRFQRGTSGIDPLFDHQQFGLSGFGYRDPQATTSNSKPYAASFLLFGSLPDSPFQEEHVRYLKPETLKL